MNILIDPETGSPRWDASEQRSGPKEGFAYEAARRLKSGVLTLDGLKDQIIAAANNEWRRLGNDTELRTLNDVKERIGKSGKDWFFEIQRVHANPVLLQKLIDQRGRGLTALSRRAGPIQSQRRKNLADEDAAIKELIAILEEARRAAKEKKMFPPAILKECRADLAKYRHILRHSRRVEDVLIP